jgi:integrase
MRKSLKVYVTKFNDRPHYQLQWTDPYTGRVRTKTTDVATSSGERGRRAAMKLAGELEQELRDGGPQPPSRVSFESFRQRYEIEVVPGLAVETGAKIQTVMNHLDRLAKPGFLPEVNEERISRFAAALRSEGIAETTIQSYLGHLKSMLNWAVGQKLLKTCPRFPKIRRRKKSGATSPMKGRPVTGEEYDRMLNAVPAVVGAAAAPAWKRYLAGLWWSGLRLRESLDLTWNRHGGLVPVFPENGRPMLLVPADLEKGHTDRILPIAPEFAMFLQETPLADRHGPVFPLRGPSRRPSPLQPRRVSDLLSEIGKKAGGVVRIDPRNPEKIKYASAHDFRRAFGERWAARVMPAQLQELMRHESIETTLRYYVGTNATRTADACWEAYYRSSIPPLLARPSQDEPSQEETQAAEGQS